MAQSFWLKARAVRLQSKAFRESDSTPKDLALLMRYQTSNQRIFYKALNALTKLQSQRKNHAIGFVSQKRFVERQTEKTSPAAAPPQPIDASAQNPGGPLHLCP
jgi:hypothetical protein